MQLEYSQEEILSDHEFTERHQVREFEFHGGFDAAGHYLSPRTRKRGSAVRNWTEALRSRGGALQPVQLPESSVPPYPNVAQVGLLIEKGLDRILWDALTDIGRTEAAALGLKDVEVPDFGSILEDEISGWALAHMGAGLLLAHGLDEGGSVEGGPGAHDRMWYAMRDLAMGPDRYPLPEAVPEPPRRAMNRRIPEIPEAHEGFVRFLMGVLLLELLAFPLFSFVQELLLQPRHFPTRREHALDGARILDRLRQDESIHVRVLRTALGELRNARFVTASGPRKGSELLDPVWERTVRYFVHERPEQRRRAARQILPGRIRAYGGSDALLQEFEDLGAQAA